LFIWRITPLNKNQQTFNESLLDQAIPLEKGIFGLRTSNLMGR
jgi:hypothetical protein